MAMLDEDLEFRLSQLADGSLPIEQQAAVQEVLRSDPAAQTAFEQYRRLDDQLAGLRRPLDSKLLVNWDRLSQQLSSAVDQEDDSENQPAVWGRIPAVATSWRVRSVAAAVMVAAGVFLLLHHKSVAPSNPVIAPTQIQVSGPAAEIATGPAVTVVRVGPSAALAKSEGSWRYGDGVVIEHKPHVAITAGITPPAGTAPQVH